MYVANAWKRTQRSKAKDDSPLTAGVAKTSGGFKTAQELKAMGERYGWVAGAVSPDDVKAMGADRLRWEELFNKEALEKALALPDKHKQYDAAVEQWKAKSFWDNAADISPELNNVMVAEFRRFIAHYPQFRSAAHGKDNSDALFDWLRDRHLYPVYSNLVLAFEACALAGRLWLNPSAIAAGTETEVIGTQHHNFHLLIQRQVRNTDDGLSADEYLAQHEELKDMRTPPLVQAREQRNANTAAYFQQAEAATAKSGSTTVTEYPNEPSGYLTHSKYSFKKYLAGLSAKDFQEKLNDPTFLAALDRTSDGNK